MVGTVSENRISLFDLNDSSSSPKVSPCADLLNFSPLGSLSLPCLFDFPHAILAAFFRWLQIGSSQLRTRLLALMQCQPLAGVPTKSMFAAQY